MTIIHFTASLKHPATALSGARYLVSRRRQEVRSPFLMAQTILVHAPTVIVALN